MAAIRAAKVLDNLTKKLKGDQKTGVDIIRWTLSAPLKQIAVNAGLDGSIVWQEISAKSDDPNYGYNALTAQYGDLVKMGVLVPPKVERVALQNAASIASLLLTTDCVISEIKEKEKRGGAGAGMPGGGMGGMM